MSVNYSSDHFGKGDFLFLSVFLNSFYLLIGKMHKFFHISLLYLKDILIDYYRAVLEAESLEIGLGFFSIKELLVKLFFFAG